MNRVSEVRTDLAHLSVRKFGSLPRLCWPPSEGLSLDPKVSAPAVLDRSPVPLVSLVSLAGSPGSGLARRYNRNEIGLFFLSELPPGCPKRNEFRSPWGLSLIH